MLSSLRPEEDDLKFVLGHMPGQRPRPAKTPVIVDDSSIEMFAISLAFACQSGCPCMNELMMSFSSRAYPETLSKTGNIRDTKYCSKKVGVFLLRYKISSTRDARHPWYWESDEYEPLYTKARKYLEMDKRMGLLNQKLDIVRELFDMLSGA